MERLIDEMVDDIINTPDNEIINECIENGKNPKVEADKIRKIINEAKITTHNIRDKER